MALAIAEQAESVAVQANETSGRAKCFHGSNMRVRSFSLRCTPSRSPCAFFSIARILLFKSFQSRIYSIWIKEIGIEWTA